MPPNQFLRGLNLHCGQFWQETAEISQHFLHGRKANRHNKDEPAAITFQVKPTIVDQEPAHTESAYIEELSDSTSIEPKKWCTKSEVWGTDATRQSERISNQGASEKVLVTKAISNPEIWIPKAYTDAINSPEGKLWKEAMDYELTKLEEMSTRSEVDQSDMPADTQILPGMWYTWWRAQKLAA